MFSPMMLVLVQLMLALGYGFFDIAKLLWKVINPVLVPTRPIRS